MSAFAAALGFLLIIAAARTEDAPKGPKVTHKVSIVDYLSSHCHSIDALDTSCRCAVFVKFVKLTMTGR